MVEFLVATAELPVWGYFAIVLGAYLLGFVAGCWTDKKKQVDSAVDNVLLQSELASREMHDLTRQAFVAMAEESERMRDGR